MHIFELEHGKKRIQVEVKACKDGGYSIAHRLLRRLPNRVVHVRLCEPHAHLRRKNHALTSNKPKTRYAANPETPQQ